MLRFMGSQSRTRLSDWTELSLSQVEFSTVILHGCTSPLWEPEVGRTVIDRRTFGWVAPRAHVSISFGEMSKPSGQDFRGQLYPIGLWEESAWVSAKEVKS